MKGRRTNERFVLGICALVGVLSVVGCESLRREPERGRTAIARSDEVIVLNDGTVRRRTSPSAVSDRNPVSQRFQQSPFHDFDQALVDRIEKRWDDILDQGTFSFKTGVVVLQFTLSWDGAVSGMKVTENTANEQAAAISRKAILDAAPYPPWPATMRRQVGDKRVITFTFNYLK